MIDKASFEFVRPVDVAALAAADPKERISLGLLLRNNGAESLQLTYIRTPPGGGSPEGLHYHEVDQVFYVLSGTMFVEIDGEEFTVEPQSVVVFPVGVPHRNWNDEETIHLAMATPLPEAGKPFAIPVGPR